MFSWAPPEPSGPHSTTSLKVFFTVLLVLGGLLPPASDSVTVRPGEPLHLFKPHKGEIDRIARELPTNKRNVYHCFIQVGLHAGNLRSGGPPRVEGQRL